MIRFTTTIQKFGTKGEKTGWRYIEISARQAHQLKPDTRVGFRVKGKLDQLIIEKTALLPMGHGGFILPLNGTMRKALGKSEDEKLHVQLEADGRDLTPSADFIACLKDDPRAWAFFKTLPMSHQRYFSKWIESAKTIHTKTKRITMAVVRLSSHGGFGEMIRANKGKG